MKPAGSTVLAPVPIHASLEAAALGHAGTLVILSTWALAGASEWSRLLLSALGSLAAVVTVLEFLQRRSTSGASLHAFRWLWPLLALNVLVIASAFQPSFRLLTLEGRDIFVPLAVTSAAPSSAQPTESLLGLWLFDGLYLSSFNLAVAVRSRTKLRRFLRLVGFNALLLAVFGSLQKLLQSPGLFFGTIPSPNTRFFASFIYPNHWGAFAVLMLSVWLALLFSSRDHSARRYRDFFHSPAFAGVVAVVVLGAALALAASRACSLMAAILLGAGLIHAVRRIRAARSGQGGRALWWLAVFGVFVVLSTAASLYLAKRDILARARDTRGQLTEMTESRSLGARVQLYTDTWRMALERPVFGWGFGSYPIVFTLFNRQTAVDGLPVHFEDAHSDWLQSFAEVGLVGSTLRALLLILPLAAVRRAAPLTAEPRYLLAGCGLILAYAWVEFPFGNPAVTLCFGIVFFAAVRLAQLEARERG